MNKAMLCGRLTKDPRISYTPANLCVARYTLAVDRPTKEQQAADFIPCVAFGRAAEFAERYLKQGTKVLISGRIQTGSYTDRDGKKVYTTDVIIEEQEFAESKNAGTQGPKNEEHNEPAADADGFLQIPEGTADALPFQ